MMLDTVTCYIEKDNSFLMLFRNKKEHDMNKGKYIGVGGKIEKNELPHTAVLREVKEETGLDLIEANLRGIVYFKMNDYEEKMYVYTSSKYSGEIIECNEGTLEFVKKKDLSKKPMWEGDKYFIDLLVKNEKYFEYQLIYENDVLVDHKRLI